jgi:hypothetical protein
MRAKVILCACALALGVLLPAVYFRFKSDTPAPVPAPAVAEDTSSSPEGLPSILKRVTPKSEGTLARSSGPARPSGLSHEEYVLQRRAELSELGMNNDPDSLKTILSELENPDAEIRQAALTATLDFGSKDAIPSLQNEMAYATDPQEKVDLQKAIDFLELPRLGEDDSGSTAQR